MVLGGLAQGCSTLFVTVMSLRQTVDRRQDLVIGDIVAELKARLAAVQGRGLEEEVGDEPAQLVTGTAGQLVELQGLTIRLGYSNLALADTLDQAYLQAMALVDAFISLPAKWIPDIPSFSRLFRRPIWKKYISTTASQIWASVLEISLEVVDDPFQSWLEFMAPIWMAELAARQVRLEQMARQVEVIMRTYATGEAERIAEAMEDQLRLLHADYYLRNVQRKIGVLRQSRPSILSCTVKSCEVGAVLRPGTKADLEDLDEDPIPEEVIFDMCLKAEIKVDLSEVHARLRWSTDPLAVVDKICLEGGVVVARHATWDAYSVEQVVSIAPDLQPCRLRRSFVPPMFYLDLAVHTEGLQASYVPGFEQTLEEIGLALVKLLPPVFFLDPEGQADPLPWWDVMRRLVHGRVAVSCYATLISLISPDPDSLSHIRPASASCQPELKSASSHESTAERLDIQLSIVELSYAPSLIKLGCWGILIQQQPNPYTLPPLMEIPSVGVRLDLEWQDDQGQGSNGKYRIYPTIEDNRFRHTSRMPLCSNGVQTNDRFACHFRSQSVAMKVAVEILTLPEEELEVESHLRSKVSVASGGESLWVERGVQQALMCVKGAATVMVYGVSIPWASSWLTSFLGSFARAKVRRHERQVLSRALDRFRGHISAVHIESVSLDGLNIFAYDTHPLDEYRHGLRMAITGELAFSGSITEEEIVQDPFATGRVKLPDLAKPFWSIHQVGGEDLPPTRQLLSLTLAWGIGVEM